MLVGSNPSAVAYHRVVDALFVLFLRQVVEADLDDMVPVDIQGHLQDLFVTRRRLEALADEVGPLVCEWNDVLEEVLQRARAVLVVSNLVEARADLY